MKRILFLFLFLSIFKGLIGQESTLSRFVGFRWTEDGSNILRIDEKKLEVNSEDIYGKITIIGKLKASPDVFKDLPPLFNTNNFLRNNDVFFTIKGTGQVYKLNLKTLALNRLDNTFFRGYNFSAHQFFRNDTLFSIGGSGFWMDNSLITFYNPKTREWDLLNAKNKNITGYVNYDFSGYIKENDVFFSAKVHPDSLSKNVAVSYYSFKDSLWTVKGFLTPDVKDFLKKNFRYLWTGRYALFFNSELLVLDPLNNKAYRMKRPIDNFSDYSIIISMPRKSRDGRVYFRNLNTENTGQKFDIDSMSVEELIQKSTAIGQIYDEESSDLVYIASVSGILILSFILFVFLKNRSKSIQFTAKEILVLKAFFDLEQHQTIDTQKLTDFFGIADKSYDNQRKIRNLSIAKLNDKLNRKFFVTNAIHKTAKTDDKRMSSYSLSDKIKSKGLNAILN